MKRLFLPLLLIMTMPVLGMLAGTEVPGEHAASEIERSGANTPQLKQALDAVPDDQAKAMQFLIAHMPERDLKSLSAEFLLEHVDLAYRAWTEATWKDRLDEAIFLNDVLPYAVINERRDNWRADFYKRFKPLAAEAQTPSEAAMILNREIFKLLDVQFSRNRPKADQSPYETIEAGTASCTGLSILLIDACRAVGVPARLAGTPLWSDGSGNHSWVEIWDGQWHYIGAAEPAGSLDSAWFTEKVKTAQRDDALHAIYATSFKPTEQTFPLAWDRNVDYVFAVNVTDRYTDMPTSNPKGSPSSKDDHFDMEASLHGVNQLKTYLQTARSERTPLDEQPFATVALTLEDAATAQALLWADHVELIRQTREAEMKVRQLTAGEVMMPFYYSVNGKKPDGGRSLYISLHGGGGTTQAINDGQWENQKTLYKIPEGIYLAPRAPTNTWNMWHQEHIDGLFDRLIENLIVFEDVNPNRVYLLGYSAGGDGVYRLGPRMADRWAAAAMMAGHPGDASPVNLYQTPFTIHVGGKDTAYNRNNEAAEWGRQLDELQEKEPGGYIHWTKIYEDKRHWVNEGGASALPWMAQYTRNPQPQDVIWRQDQHKRFCWLAAKTLQPGVLVRAMLNGQRIDVQPGDAEALIIRLNDDMLNLDEEVTVYAEDRELFKGRIDRTIATLKKTLAERGDSSSVYSGRIVISFDSTLR